ncbi:MAG: phosphatase PAP2 family protein [Candidatus Micrarchaeota archaeon]
MDKITFLISHLDVSLITNIAIFLDNDVNLIMTILLLVVLTEQRMNKVGKIIFAIILATLIGAMLKQVIQFERPCVSNPAKIVCPSSFSFPSGHTLLVFTVFLAFLNKKYFPIYLAFGIFVAFSRIYLGVHSLEDIAGSIALAPLVYYITDGMWNFIGKTFERNLAIPIH